MSSPILELLNLAHFITFDMEELIQKLEGCSDNFEKMQLYSIDEIDSIIAEIDEYSDKIYVYAARYKCEVDYWMGRDINECMDFLEGLKKDIANMADKKALNGIVFRLFGIAGVWDDKHILHLTDWLVGLLPQGLHLDDEVIVYSSDDFQDYVTMLKNAMIAENLFYSLEMMDNNKQMHAVV